MKPMQIRVSVVLGSLLNTAKPQSTSLARPIRILFHLLLVQLPPRSATQRPDPIVLIPWLIIIAFIGSALPKPLLS